MFRWAVPDWPWFFRWAEPDWPWLFKWTDPDWPWLLRWADVALFYSAFIGFLMNTGWVHCIMCYRLLSQKDYTVGSATDLPPFNRLIIKNDGQIKIEQLHMDPKSRSSLLITRLLRREECGSGTEAKSDSNWPETQSFFSAIASILQN